MIGSPDPELAWLDDDHAATQFAKRMGSHESLDKRQGAARVLGSRPTDEDPGMATWWVAPQVTDPAVEGEQEPALISCCRHDHRVTLASELLIDDRVDIMAVAT